MELYQLKSFVAVVHERNLTRAADRVFTSVPAVSAQIRSLEEELGVKLFDRTSKGMEPTSAGIRLLDEAQRTLEAAGRVRAAAAGIRGEVQGQVRVGTVSDPLTLRLGQVMVKLAQRHPQLTLQLQQGLSITALRAVRRGELDGAYVLHPDAEAEGLDMARLAPMDVAVALPLSAGEGAPGLSLQQVCRLPWITTPPECGLRHHLEHLFREAGQEPNPGWTADAEGAVRGMVASGIGAGLMRLDSALEAQRAGELRVWEGWRGKTWLCWAQRVTELPVPSVNAVRDAVREVWS